MAVALVQQQATVGGSTATTMAFVLGATPTNGNMIVCASGHNDSGTPALAGTGVTWTLQDNFLGDGSHDNIALWTGVVGASASATQTITWSGATANCAGIMAEFSGVQQVVDGTCPAATNVSSATPSVTSATPTVTGDLGVAFCETVGTAVPTGTPSTWTTLTAATNTRRIDAAYLVLPSTAAVSPQWTFAASQFALLEIALIKATVVAAAAGPVKFQAIPFMGGH